MPKGGARIAGPGKRLGRPSGVDMSDPRRMWYRLDALHRNMLREIAQWYELPPDMALRSVIGQIWRGERDAREIQAKFNGKAPIK